MDTFRDRYTGVVTPPDASQGEARRYRFKTFPGPDAQDRHFDVQIDSEAFEILNRASARMRNDPSLGPRIARLVDEVERHVTLGIDGWHPDIQLTREIAERLVGQKLVDCPAELLTNLEAHELLV